MSQEQPRRTSFGMLLRRSKSGDLGKGGRKQRELELQRQRDAVPKSPPRLPALHNGASFGGDARPDSLAIVSGQTGGHDNYDMPQQYPPSGRASMDPGRPSMSMPPPAVPPVPSGAWVDPYARTESMAHRGRYSYASSAISTINSPRRVRRRKDPTPFNVLVVGTTGSGKTSFLEFLKKSLTLPAKKRSQRATEIGEEVHMSATASGNFIPHYVESEFEGERVGVTLWDSEGLEKNVVDLQLREMSAFLESKFEETFNEEMKVIRSPGVQDTHIHAVFLILDPARLDRNISASRKAAAAQSPNPALYIPTNNFSGLDDDLDMQVLRTLQGKTSVIPVISKADTITTKHMAILKKNIWTALKKANFDPLEALGLEDDDDITPDSSKIDEDDEEADEETEEPRISEESGEASERVQSPISATSRSRSNNSAGREESTEAPQLPMSIISPDLYEPDVIGREFPWGFADPYDENHCDFTRLKESVFSEWRGELREASRDQWYEGWRTSRLKHREPSVRRR